MEESTGSVIPVAPSAIAASGTVSLLRPQRPFVTPRALTLKEAQLAPVQYIPREDAQMDLFDRTDHASHCPYKGDASYYTVTGGGIVARNAVWTYEHPLASVSAIAGHLAFYPEKVDAIEELRG